EIREVRALGIPAVLLFGVPEHKDAVGTSAYEPDGIVQRAVRQVKAIAPDLTVITDTCLCQFTDHGHCGIVRQVGGQALIDNDESLKVLARTAVSQAEAGADVIAPSNMMDGFVSAIRAALDEAEYSH